jgi:predicted Zn-dependent protease
MKNFLKLIFSIALLFSVWYFFRTEIEKDYKFVMARFFPCQVPIKYTLGQFDNRFGLSKSEFLSAVNTAEDLWSQAVGKDLFEYSEKDNSDKNMKVNLVYDYRQEATDKLKTSGVIIKNNQASYDELRAKYLAMQSQYLRDREAYLKMPQSREKEKQRQKINAEVDEINGVVVVLNQLAKNLNLNVAKYNEIGQSVGSEFEEGLYESDATGQRITIYQFDTKDKLVRVLAHEFGHAVGLDHVDDRTSIMYAFNSGSGTQLSNVDKEAIKTRCGIK